MEQLDLTKELSQQGLLLMRAENFVEAQKKFEQAIECNPMVADSYMFLGNSYAAQKLFTEAKNAYKKAILIEKKGIYYFFYGNACVMNDETSEGLQQYNLALQNGFDSPQMYFYMANIYRSLNDYTMSLRYYQKAIQKDVVNVNYRRYRIDLLVSIGEYEQAMQDIDDLLEMDADSFDGYYLKIKLLLKQDKNKEANKFATNAIKRFPEDIRLLLEYINTCLVCDDLDEAMKQIQKAKQMKYFEVEKHNVDSMEVLVLAQMKKYDEAIQLCKEVMCNIEEYDMRMSMTLLNLYVAKEEFVLLEQYAHELVEQKRYDQLYYAAMYYEVFAMQKQNKPEALTCFKEINSLYRLYSVKHPEMIELYTYRILCLKEMKEYDKAMELIDFMFSLNVNAAELHLIKADIYEAQERQVKATEERELAYALNPKLRK